MRILVWHWGRRGAGPLFAQRLSEAINQLGTHQALLSLAAGAELLSGPNQPDCAWVEPTYRDVFEFILQKCLNPFLAGRTQKKLARLQPDFAICAMPALLDQRLIKALQQQNIPYAVIVHDAQPHPGDLLSFRLLDQERLLRGASCLITLSSHVAGELHAQNYGQNGQKIIKLWHPPFSFGAMAPPLAHGGAPRVLFFGRLLPYKGLDLLADALSLLGAARPFIVKICGEGPATPELDRLRNLPNVTVDQRWIPESELPALLAWSDALVLPYREASQSGVAAAALAQGRYVLATNVGGLREQLEGQARAHLVEPNAAAIAAGLTGLFAPAHHTQTVDLTGDWLSMAAQMTASLERMT